MPAAVSVVAAWAAGHSLSISADSSGAALFCIASHRQSDEDTADHRLGGGKPRVNPTLCVCSAMRLIDTSILFRTSPSLQGRPCHAYQRRVTLSTWPPVQHRCGGLLGSAHPHGTNASHVSVILRTCVAQYARKPHLRQYLGRQRRPFRCREMPSSRNCDASAAA
ncbi:hypothetical protein TcYC6_0057810 [Trypanosoma cruzi]|nr:hypothetical protein TcYC6_0057810 [Trypanosoma cruzi]